MSKDSFKISYRKTDHLDVVVYIMIEIVLIMGAPAVFRAGLVGGVFLCIFSLGLFFLFSWGTYGSLMFRVQVSGSHIKVRNRSGRKYAFNISDIEGVVCESVSSVEHGTHNYVSVMAKAKRFWLHQDMVGFYDMVEYILDKYGSGEIKEGAISEKNLKELRWHKEQGRGKKEKKRKRKP